MKGHRKRLLLITLLAVLLLPPGWLWYTLLSPWGYTAPEGLPAVEPTEEYRVFVYGTLTRSWVRWLVTGEYISTRPAQLEGYYRDGLNLIPKADARTEGQLMLVSGENLLDLDRYERLGIRYERTQMMLSDGRSAWVYTRLALPEP
ncbi:gamma-glutamylcyclotransferase [Marinobacterium sp. AK62]|uniref:Gamma-glutamylcyclotransferase n=1 Tax=Marinobacterium alkalitolerans TaxID=1542925 RepID=A0ABS3Z803_9GAMM|nr:gamma-glutamylcyclotransferase family protein [Marinobacterium alkalitolerans]MBP0047841.1 gamma-glutamylcyclotransferase [Marinobacterium alkalitolerans]